MQQTTGQKEVSEQPAGESQLNLEAEIVGNSSRP